MTISFPSLDANPNFQDVAEWLTEASNALVGEGNAALEDLKALADIDFTSVGTSAPYNATQWAIFLNGIGQAPTPPVLTTTNLNTILQQILLLTPPVAPTLTFSYNDPGYNSQLRQYVADKLIFDLINGGYGIDVNDEQALFDRARDREAQLLSENELNVTRQAAGTGFPLPQGALFKQLEKARSEYVAKNSSVNRDIALKRADLFVANRRQVIEQAMKYEDQGIELYNAIQNRTLLAARTQVEMAVFLFDSGVKLFQSRLAALTSQVESQLAINQALVNIHASSVAAYAATVNAAVQGARVDLENSKNSAEHALNVWRSNVQITSERLRQLVADVDNRRDVAKYISEFMRTGLGSAMNGINGLAVQTGEAPEAT